MLTLICMMVVLFASVAVCVAVLSGRRWHIRYTGDTARGDDHKVHTGTIPRIGGVAVYIAGLFGMVLLTPDMAPKAAAVVWMLWGCLTLTFAVGLAEDLTRAIPPFVRYSVSILAAVLFSLAYGQFGITSVAIAPVDFLLGFSLFSVLFFAFAVAGLSHAFNLIDGENGLCAGYSMMVYVVLAMVAGQVGEVALAELCLVMAMATLGFMIFNFPAGQIFLGDGGAYFNGAIIAVLTVMIVESSAAVSPWFAILLLVYPVWETLFSMFRRYRAGNSLYQPDRDHLHHRLRAFLRRRAPMLAEVSAIPALALSAPFVITAAFAAGDTALLIGYAAAFVLLYLVAYYTLRPVEVTADEAAQPVAVDS